MALGAYDALDASIERMLVITKDGHVAPELIARSSVEIRESGHPVPDQRSLEAGERLLRWLRELPPLVEVLEDSVTLEHLGRSNAEGLASGMEIVELNARRSGLSRLKGGGVARLLRNRPARALFISDVPGDDPAMIGSGPVPMEPTA
jgi:glycerate 2-kinase